MAKAADDMQPQQTWINRRGSKRTVPMEVLALGFSRTETLCRLDSALSYAVINANQPMLSYAPGFETAWLQRMLPHVGLHGEPAGRRPVAGGG